MSTLRVLAEALAKLVQRVRRLEARESLRADANDEYPGHTVSGAMGVGGAPVAGTILTLTSTTGALLLPRMTTVQKTALAAVNGMIVYDTTLNVVAAYENGAWVDL